LKSKILLVDDSPDFLRIFRHILGHRGYKVDVAENGETALKKYTVFKPDIVTLDLGMSGMNGYETLERILRIDRNAKVIIVTASPFATRQECLKSGAAGLITKPFESEDLIKTMEECLVSIKLVH
jgi:two-component system chemotaxis response regulator CheY